MEIYDSFGLDITLIIYLGAELRYHLLVCMHNDREENIETISPDQSFSDTGNVQVVLRGFEIGHIRPCQDICATHILNINAQFVT